VAFLVTDSIDVVVLQNPTASDPVWIARFLPVHPVTDLVVDAGFSTGLDPAPFGTAHAMLVVTGAAAAVASCTIGQ